MSLSDEYILLRSYLWAVAYDMTGAIQEAEDIVQDGFEAISRKQDGEVANPKAYFTRIIINKSMDRLKELQQQRINYPGPWLPEPVVSDADEPPDPNLLSYALTHLVEQLNPIERAVFILREAFGYSYAEIADFCNLSEANCRQLLHRAKGKIKRDEPGRNIRVSQEDPLLEAFLNASLEENHDMLKTLLQEDIRLYSDGGGKVTAARNVLKGMFRITRFLTGIIRKSKEGWQHAKRIQVNNEPGVIVYKNDLPYLVAAVDQSHGRISNIYLIRNPEKFSLANLSQKSRSADI